MLIFFYLEILIILFLINYLHLYPKNASQAQILQNKNNMYIRSCL